MTSARLIAILMLPMLLAAADPAAEALEQLRAANQARSELARETAVWTAERQRLEALIAATEAETARLARAAAEAERQRDAARAALVALGPVGGLDALRASLAEAAANAAGRLRQLARSMPPGVIALGDDSGFDAMVRTVEGAERAAGAVAVEVVTGIREGRSEAVKMLRVAGAAAWWVALDGKAAGSVRIRDGAVELLADADEGLRNAIRTALAQAEGRAAPAVVLVPGASP